MPESPLALANPEGPHFILTDEMIAEGLAASRKSKRLRIILPVQRSQTDEVQRLLNFLQPGTHIRAHCHPLPHATESIVVLQGALDVTLFSENGEVLEKHRLTPGLKSLIDIAPGVWHSIAPLEPDTIIFEVKHGPYNPETDKQFAAWDTEKGF